MKCLFRRLAKLESAGAVLRDGPWTGRAKEAEVERCAIEAMPPEDQVVLRDLFDSPDSGGLHSFVAAHPGVGERYVAAFKRATQEVPAPFVVTVFDRWA